MTLYRYEAVDRAGKVLRGVIDARNEQEVISTLNARGYSPRAVLAAPGAQMPGTVAVTRAGTASHARVSQPQSADPPVSVRSKVPIQRLAAFYRQLATLVRSGMVLSQSFGSLAAGCRDSRLRNAVGLIQRDLVSGQSLSQALAKYPGLFPAHTVGAIWCAELGGTLDTTLDEIATDLEREANEERLARIGWAITKISVWLLVLLFPVFDLKTVIAPLAAEMASATEGGGYGAAIIQATVQNLARQSLIPALLLLAIWLGWVPLKRLSCIRALMDECLLVVPVWGRLHLFRSLSVFARSLEKLYSAGVNPDSAWNAASTTPRNSAVARRLRRARAMAGISRGVGELAASAGLLDAEDVALIKAGERSGTVPASLARVADVYRQRAESLASVGRVWSLSLFVSTQIAIAGVGLIAMASSYVQALRMLGL